MNSRRNFITGLASALAGFTILPPALTYERIWKAEKKIVLAPIPLWVNEYVEYYNKLPYYFAKVYHREPASYRTVLEIMQPIKWNNEISTPN